MDVNGLNKRELGQLGEELATVYLESAGLQIVRRNYRCPKGEIDIIAMDGETLVFIEVRGRTSTKRGSPEESITPNKLRKIRQILSYYLMEQGYRQWPAIRTDILAIRFEGDDYTVNWLRGIF